MEITRIDVESLMEEDQIIAQGVKDLEERCQAAARSLATVAAEVPELAEE